MRLWYNVLKYIENKETRRYIYHKTHFPKITLKVCSEIMNHKDTQHPLQRTKENSKH
jgi:hypothetical protein